MAKIHRAKQNYEVWYCFINYLGEINDAFRLATFYRKDDAIAFMLAENNRIKANNEKDLCRAILYDRTAGTLDERIASFETHNRLDMLFR